MSLEKIDLYTYWEGYKFDYIKLCQKSLLWHCYNDFNLHFLKPADLKGKTSPLPYSAPINLRVDWLKANLIHDRGGVWIDADMIVTQNLKPLMKHLNKRTICGIPGFFGAKKGNQMLKRWIKGMEEVIEQGDLTFSDLIQPLLQDPKFKEFEPWTKEQICPIYHVGEEFWKLFDKWEDVNKYVNEKNYVVTLYNSQFSDEFKRKDQLEIISENWLISKMFRKALI